ncbi:MAG: class I SAM-dependent methyltransferase [Thermoplasmata archaeon]|nr:class I SAM-dependent methyltransferase [Thermoplasmata archaeon]
MWVREFRQQEIRFDVNPRFRDWEPMYRVSRAALARLLAASEPELDALFEETRPIQAALRAEAGPLPSAGALIQAPLLYIAVRRLRPQWVIETGISSGYSARLILEALARNGSGRLDSIGIDVFALAASTGGVAPELAGRRVGWLVPERLHAFWTLHLGRSEEVLPKLAGGDPVDVFLHDSLHQYPTMLAEYEWAFSQFATGGWLFSHDVHANRAWPDFLSRHSVAGDEEMDHDLGAVRVPAHP